MSDSGTRTPYLLCALMGLGGLFFGVTGPLRPLRARGRSESRRPFEIED